MYTDFLSTPFNIHTDDTALSAIFSTSEPARSLPTRIFLCSVQGGKAVVDIDGQSHVLTRGTFFFMGPGHLVSLLSQESNFRFSWLSYDIDFLADFPLLLKAPLADVTGKGTCLQLTEAQLDMTERYFDFIDYRYADSQDRPEIIKGLLFAFLVEVNKLFSMKHTPLESNRSRELSDEFFRLLHRHFKEERNVAFYAGKLCVSEKHLMRIVKDRTGQTIHRWCCDFVLREAKLLLKSTDMNINAISEVLHFPNPSFFARFFRQHTGTSPLKYRKNR